MSIMNNSLVLVKNNQPVTTSLKVAKNFNKSHRHVMRAIKSLIEGMTKNGHTPTMFMKSTRINPQNHQQYLFYYMNRDGFSLLVMGFNNTSKVLNWKIKFIHAFDWMENKLKYQIQAKIPKTYPAALRQLADQVDENHLLKKHRKQDLPFTNIGKTFYVSKHTELIGQFAKILKQAHLFNGGQNKLFTFMRKMDYLCHSGRNHNLPRQQFIDLGWFKIKHSMKHFNGNDIVVYLTTLITPKGQKHFINQFINWNKDKYGSKYAF